MKAIMRKTLIAIRYFALFLLMFIPSILKKKILKIGGHKIGKNCYLGLSFLNIKSMHLGDDVYIGHLNFFKKVKYLQMDFGARITNRNFFTGAGKGYLMMGENSSISLGHYMDVSAGIEIGSNTIIGGINSSFFTHGIAPDDLDFREKIKIGDWCYIGSDVRVVPGVVVPSYNFVGMGSVLNKKYSKEFVLIAGNPAKIKKNIENNCIFFNRQEIVHRHRMNRV